jgi:hypothetical protein
VRCRFHQMREIRLGDRQGERGDEVVYSEICSLSLIAIASKSTATFIE